MFSSCFHEVPQVLKLFPQDIPSSTSILSHMICPKFNSHIYKLKKGRLSGEHICFYFATGVQRGASIEGSSKPKVPKKIGDGPIQEAPSQRKIKKEKKV
jgi:hypothetical protein